MDHSYAGNRSASGLDNFIEELGRKGVVLWADGNALRYRAPHGVLTTEERRRLDRASTAIASLLDRDPLGSRPRLDAPGDEKSAARRAPLSFTQLAHWNIRREYGARPLRQVASATRLFGPIRVDLLSESVAAIARRHDALRTRIVPGEDMVPLQEVAEEYCCELELVRSRTPGVSAEVHREIERAIVGESESYHRSPLAKAVLLSINELEHVLILALDHIISDFSSLDILFREVFYGYVQLLDGGPINLPPIAIQFPAYATRLRTQCAEPASGPRMQSRVIPRTHFPSDPNAHLNGAGPGRDFIRFFIPPDMRDELRVWARHRGTTIVMASLSAYAALVLRWCDVRETAIQFMCDGRMMAGLENAIGYFAFPIYVRVELPAQATFLDILRQTTEGYCAAIDQADFGYSLSQMPAPEYTRNSGMNWLAGVGQSRGCIISGMTGNLNWEHIDYVNPALQVESAEEPGVGFYERQDGIFGEVTYPRNRFSRRNMETFAANITAFLTTLLRAPSVRVMDMKLN